MSSSEGELVQAVCLFMITIVGPRPLSRSNKVLTLSCQDSAVRKPLLRIASLVLVKFQACGLIQPWSRTVAKRSRFRSVTQRL